MNRYDVAIFDLDGTLIDSSVGIVHAVKDTIEQLGYDTLSDDFIKSCIGPPIGDSIGSKVGYTKEQIDDFYQIFRPIYKDKYLNECVIYPGINALLVDLREHGVITSIATNKRVDYTLKLLKDIGLFQLFDSVNAMDMDAKKKKSDLITDCINSNPEHDRNRFVMIGDTENDMNAAVECGVDVIGVRYGFGFKEPLDGIQFANDAKELRDLLIED